MKEKRKKQSSDSEKTEKFNKLMSEIASGSKSALKHFYKEYGKLIYIAAYSVFRNKPQSDEVVNDILLKIWRLSANIKDVYNPEGWLYKITTNAAKDKLRNDKYCELEDNLSYIDNNFAKIESKDSFYSMISSLDDFEQQIMQLRFIDDFTFKEIAEILERPLSSITSTYYGALKKLEKNIKIK